MMLLKVIGFEALKVARLVTGAVLETIMAKMDGVQGDRISVGVSSVRPPVISYSTCASACCAKMCLSFA